MKTAL